MLSNAKLRGFLASALVIVMFAGCASSPRARTSPETFPHATPAESKPEFSEELEQAEIAATPAGRKILETGRQMVSEQVVVIGGCWDFIHEMFRRAGDPDPVQHVVFRSRKPGPYAHVSQIQPGDWLYYINHSYGNIEHSGVFVSWTNPAKKEALVLSYRGEKSSVRARYSTYILNNVYRIVRAK